MEKSENLGLYLPSRDGEDVADINQISDNFRTIDTQLGKVGEALDKIISIQEELIGGGGVDGDEQELENVMIYENTVSATSAKQLKAGTSYTVSIGDYFDNNRITPAFVRSQGIGSDEEWSDVNVATLAFTPTQDAYFAITFTYDTMPADAAASILLERDGEVVDGVSATTYQDYRVTVQTPVLQQGVKYTLKIGTEETPSTIIATGDNHPPIFLGGKREVTLTPLVTTAFEILVDYARIPDGITETLKLTKTN